MKPVLKAPGTKRLKLKYDKLHSNVAFNFNLCRYTMVSASESVAANLNPPLGDVDLGFAVGLQYGNGVATGESFNVAVVRRCKLTLCNPS